ncbi:hypothetical protein [Actinoplanes sp. NPDC051851]|uniref:hypothetical protein n=1 Tax=Actinoplanes sp. NPDC051851 TaxID=3154753 RepID=UPI0034154A70
MLFRILKGAGRAPDRAVARLAAEVDRADVRGGPNHPDALVARTALATAYAAGAMVYVLILRLLRHDWAMRPGLVLIAVLPFTGPAQVWLRYRTSQATLRDLGAELSREASATLAVIAAAPPWTLRRRAREAIRILLDVDRPERRPR